MHLNLDEIWVLDFTLSLITLYDFRHIIHCSLVSVSLKLLVPVVPQIIITMTGSY